MTRVRLILYTPSAARTEPHLILQSTSVQSAVTSTLRPTPGRSARSTLPRARRPQHLPPSATNQRLLSPLNAQAARRASELRNFCSFPERQYEMRNSRLESAHLRTIRLRPIWRRVRSLAPEPLSTTLTPVISLRQDKNSSQTMTRTDHFLCQTPAFPVYSAAFSSDRQVILGGGGGATRSGISNKIVRPLLCSSLSRLILRRAWS